MVSALLYYFGWVRTGAIFSYFGVEQTMLGYSSQDYLLRSAGVAFRPAVSLLLAAAAAIILHRALAMIWQRWDRLHTPILLTVGTAGCLLVLTALGTLFGLLVPSHLLLVAVGLVAGAIVIESVSILWLDPRSSHVFVLIRRLLLTGMVIVGIFWACAIYAQDVGSRLAAGWAADLSRRPEVIIYSPNDLQLIGPGVSVTDIDSEEDQQPGYRYRYSGLRLLVYSNERWFLLPQGWSRQSTARTFVVRDTDKIRVELRPAM